MRTLNELALRRAIEFYLSDFPEELSEDEIMEIMENGDPDGLIEVWEPFFRYDLEVVIDQIDDMARTELAYFKEAIKIAS